MNNLIWGKCIEKRFNEREQNVALENIQKKKYILKCRSIKNNM